MNIVDVRQLRFTYPLQEEESLCGIDVTIEEGKFYILCGESGSGKSTLLRHLKPELVPNGQKQGEVLYCGHRFYEIPERILSSEIGYVFQNPDTQIVTDKVWHELAFGLESLGYDNETIRMRVAEMASYFGIQGWFQKNVSELSGGQKQLLNLASVMAMHPKVLLLDEPTSQLDPIAASEFLHTIHRINIELGVTIVLAEHRLEEAVSWADSILVMEQGRIIAKGNPVQLGQRLRDMKSEMFLAMPAPMRIYAATDSRRACPYTVAMGRKWLEEELRDWSSVEAVRKRNDSGRGALEVRELPRQRNGSCLASKKSAAICLKEVWFRYERDLPDVIRGFSLEVRQGEIFALLGGNGTGKSTVLRLMAGLLQPYRGRIYLEGKRITKYTEKSLYQGCLGVLPQNPQSVFVKKTVEEDLREILCEKDKETGDEMLNEIIGLMGLRKLLKRHPYDLSGGEQQKAALAKVLLLEPKILLLDEPTKGLDARFKLELGQLLQRLSARGMTIVLVSHDIEFCAEYAKRAGLFFEGNVVSVKEVRAFFAGNYFYTTTANRMARQYFPQAVTTGEVIEGIEKVKRGEVPEGLVPEKEVETEGLVPEREVEAEGLVTVKAASLEGSLAVENAEESSTDIEKEMRIADRKSKVYSSRLSKCFLLSLLLVVPFIIWIGGNVWGDRRYLAVSLIIAVYSLLPFLVFFEHKKAKVQHLVVIAVLVALAVAGRAAFFMVPSVKPMAAITIIAAVSLGGESGFLVGALSMLASNMLFGQGPWTPWQMFSMGMVGLFAGLLFYGRKRLQKRRFLCTYGFLSVIICYGAVMNTASLIMMSYQLTKENLIAIYLSGIPIDLIHAVATVIFLLLAGRPMLEKLERVKKKINHEEVM